MSLDAWIAGFGVLLLLAALASGWIRRLPLTTFWLFLGAGVIGGPWGLDRIWLDFPGHPDWLAWATEVAMVISLFVAGLKLRMPADHPAWRTALRLALPGMLLCIAGVCLAAHIVLDMSWPLALACAAMLAPTDPVLASIVAVDSAADRDAMRGALSGEAGLNDGAAMPFLVLALSWMNDGATLSLSSLAPWFAHYVLWSLPAGLLIGGGTGWALGLLGTRTKSHTNDVAPSDFLALAIMMIAYAMAEWLSASAFLAAFAAGIGLRRAELSVVSRHPHDKARKDMEGDDDAIHPPAELLVERHAEETDELAPAESVGMVVSDALSFGGTLERMLAAALLFATGAALADHWSFQGIALALLLFAVIRPLSVYIATTGSRLPRPRRVLMGWLGVRGIGTINYLSYALTHDADGADAQVLTALAITTVAMSVVMHGATAQPLMHWRERRLERAS